MEVLSLSLWTSGLTFVIGPWITCNFVIDVSGTPGTRWVHHWDVHSTRTSILLRHFLLGIVIIANVTVLVTLTRWFTHGSSHDNESSNFERLLTSQSLNSGPSSFPYFYILLASWKTLVWRSWVSDGHSDERTRERTVKRSFKPGLTSEQWAIEEGRRRRRRITLKSHTVGP